MLNKEIEIEIYNRLQKSKKTFWIGKIISSLIILIALYMSYNRLSSHVLNTFDILNKIGETTERNAFHDLLPMIIGYPLAIIIYFVFDNEKIWTCPSCDKKLPVSDGRLERGYPKLTKYCQECGEQLTE